jgi:hypothetical protein
MHAYMHACVHVVLHACMLVHTLGCVLMRRIVFVIVLLATWTPCRFGSLTVQGHRCRKSD